MLMLEDLREKFQDNNNIEVELINTANKRMKKMTMTKFYGKYKMYCAKKGDYEVKITNNNK